MNTVILGDSVAAKCCAHLLKSAGFEPRLERTERARLPAIMLSDAALTLIRDVFGRPDLFSKARRITRRVVQWGGNARVLALDHSASVVSEQELLGDLEQGLEAVDKPSGPEADFTMYASRPLPPGPIEHSFGSRLASAARIGLKDARDSTSCWIESLDEGWLFLIPNEAESGWLLSVGGPLQQLLGHSRLIAERLSFASDPVGHFPASPRIMSALGGSGWLACGTAGMAFDPICGDGTAHAVREAVLASAVVKAISAHGNAKELLSHYEARLILGFQRHLAACCAFYGSGNCGPWWDKELESLRQGLSWCADRMKSHGQFRYRLSGLDLQTIDCPAVPDTGGLD